MNILIPHSWLTSFVSTKAKPEKIAELLSLHSFSVENVHKAEDNDLIYEIEITPNRPDAMSVLGIARELNAVLKQQGIDTKFEDHVANINWTEEEKKVEQPLHLEVQIKNPELAPRFTAIILKNIQVKDSPKYIKKRLQKVGIRSLNNVIDITNYLMIERGQPMHAFDYDKVHNGKMILRRSIQGETVTTLDGETRKLPQGAIVIEDSEKIIDLCGIMGGDNSKVDNKTNKVILFVQIYDPTTIRKTIQKLGFRTEAATRFEKGMDPQGVIPALNQAAEFLKKEANGELASPLIDIKNIEYQSHKVPIHKEKIKEILGINIELEKVNQILELLGFQPNSNQDESIIQTTVPSWRNSDIQIPEDIIEEIARIYGYHQLAINLPPLPKKLPKEEGTFFWENKIKTALKGWGFTELYSYSFTNTETLSKAQLNPEQAVEINNPLTTDLSHLRPDLLPTTLEVIKNNQAGFANQKLFQLSRVFSASPQSEIGIDEVRQLVIVNYSRKSPSKTLFFKTKGVLEALAKELNLNSLEFTATTEETSLWRPKSSSAINLNSNKIGELGILNQEIVSNFEIEGTIAAGSLDPEKIIAEAKKTTAFKPVPQHPPVIEDLTIVADKSTVVGELKKTINNQQKDNLIIKAEFQKTYIDEQLAEENAKAVTFKLEYRSTEKTLSDKEVKKIREKILQRLEKEHRARLRN